MVKQKLFRSNRVGLAVTLSIFFLHLQFSVFAQNGLRLPRDNSPLVSLTPPPRNPTFSLDTSRFGQEFYYPNSFRWSVQFDSLINYVTVSRLFQDRHILPPRRMTFQDYLRQRSQIQSQAQWNSFIQDHIISRSLTSRRGRGIVIETPKIKSEAFRRMFGGETLSLNVNGNITIDGSMRNEKRSQARTATNRSANTSFQMKQTQRLNVEGKIGENVSIFVDQDSERPFEFENAIKLNYSSDEDGIIQIIDAGNVSLSLPGTQFVTFSASNSGLFGIKSQFKVGKLDITAIASMEKAEKKRQNFPPGTDKKETKTIYDYQYKPSTYFFIDSLFREHFTVLNANGVHISYRKITEIEVFKSTSNTNDPEGWAIVNPNKAETDTLNIGDPEVCQGHFIRMDVTTDYYVDPDLGYIALNFHLQEGEVLAVSYRDSVLTSGIIEGRSAGDTRLYGMFWRDVSQFSSRNTFKLIKPQSSRPEDRTWPLEWKNVYDLGGRNIEKEGFEIKIYRKSGDGNDQEVMVTKSGKRRGFLEVFGLDDWDENAIKKPDNIIDFNDNYLNLARGELIFPDLQPFDPIDPERRSALEESQDNLICAFYDTTNTKAIQSESKFYMEVTSSSARSSTYDLGFNIIENSEEVTLNGRKLKKGEDYTIEYFSGKLTLLSEEALNPNANLDISYESHEMFSVDKESILGTRAEYTLWENGSQRSFIGGTFLFKSKSTLDRRVRVGKDSPMRNLLWDLNTSLQFNPEFLTKAMEVIPFIHATGPSSLSFEGEIAQVVPNPNTLNNKSTGDKNGVAYLDDFEGSKRITPLSVIRSGWSPCSPPTTAIDSARKDYMRSHGHLIWYNPYEQVAITNIWPNREISYSMGGTQRVNVLALEFTPNPNIDNPKVSWDGIQRSLSAGYADQTESRFLEIWIQGDMGCLNLDFGLISEDLIPNQNLDTEDKLVDNFRNNLLDDDEDTGIDGIFGDDPSDPFHPHEYATIDGNQAQPYDFWDINQDNLKQEDEPWSYDNYYYQYQSGKYDQINGTENSRAADVTIYPDDEDLNGNRILDLTNNYFRFSFSLDKNHPDTSFIAGGKPDKPNNDNPDYGWRLYRIPLDSFAVAEKEKMNISDWSRIDYVRIWIDGVERNQTAKIRIAEINLVGNEWELGYETEDDTLYQYSALTVAEVNTHDNPEYNPPPGVEGEYDPIQKIRGKEQSLVLKLTELLAGDSVKTKKTFPSNFLNNARSANKIIDYKTLKMFIHGGDQAETFPSDQSVIFFIRLGSDSYNRSYYEVRLPVFPGWNEKNEIKLDFGGLSRLKLEKQSLGITTLSDTLSNGHIISVSGNPSLSKIQWLILGVLNEGQHPFTGEIWIDELRVSNVRKDKGVAMRARGDIRISDFISLNGDYSRKDADFHTINESYGQGSNSESYRINGSIQLHKLLPTSIGISIPVSANYSKSSSTPKFMPGSDVLVEDVKTAALLDSVQNINKTMGLNISLKKRTKARNFLVRYLIDPINTSFSYTQTDLSSSQISFSKNVGYSGSLTYNLTFGNQFYFQPLKWLGQKNWIKKLSEVRFYYLPSSLNLSLTAKDSKQDQETREHIATDRYQANLSRSVSTTIKPLQMLSSNYSRSWNLDMRESEWSEVLSALTPGIPTSINQNFGADLKPNLFNWLTHNLSYNTTYQWSDNIQMREQGTNMSASTSRKISFSGTFKPSQLIKSLTKKSPSRRSRNNTRRPRVSKETDTEKEEEKDVKEKKSFPFLKIILFPKILLSQIDPLSISYTRTFGANERAILGIPSLNYQFGLSKNPNVNYFENFAGQTHTEKVSSNFSIRSGFKISSRISTTLDYSYNETSNFSTEVTGNTSSSSLLMKDRSIPFPNWSVQFRGLEKLPLLSKIIRSASLSHGYSGTKTATWKTRSNNIAQEQVSADFRPLIGFNLSFINGMTTNFQYSSSVSLQKTQQGLGSSQNRNTKNNISITASYSKRGGIKLPFMKNRLDNNIDFSFNFNLSNNKTHSKKSEEGKFVKTASNSNWSLKPSIKYSFTSNVTGGTYLELGERNDLRMGKTKITAFGINVNISLAGK